MSEHLEEKIQSKLDLMLQEIIEIDKELQILKPLIKRKSEIRKELFYIMELSEITLKNYNNLYAEIKNVIDVQIDFPTLESLSTLLTHEEFEKIVGMKIRAAELKKLDVENKSSNLQKIVKSLLQPKTTYKFLRYKKSILLEDGTNIVN